jgi:phosphoribosylamine---glycine ligase
MGLMEAPQAGDRIDGIEVARAEGALVFGAGVKRRLRGGYATAGGRVLSVVGRGADVGEASAAATRAAQLVSFKGRQLRTDIGASVVSEQPPIGIAS